MNKKDYLAQLEKQLSGLPKDDVAEHLAFYNEMIEDRIEEGLSEPEAVAAVGDVGKIAAQIIADTPLTKIAAERIKPKRRLRVWEIILLVLGFPLWFPLLMAAFSVGLALYICLLAVLICLWAVWAAAAGCAVGCTLSGIGLACNGEVFPGIALLGGGLLFAGMAILLFILCKAASRGTWFLTGKIGLGIKRSFMGKENG